MCVSYPVSHWQCQGSWSSSLRLSEEVWTHLNAQNSSYTFNQILEVALRTRCQFCSQEHVPCLYDGYDFSHSQRLFSAQAALPYKDQTQYLFIFITWYQLAMASSAFPSQLSHHTSLVLKCGCLHFMAKKGNFWENAGCTLPHHWWWCGFLPNSIDFLCKVWMPLK